jgi:hypothetical protein
MPNPHQELTIMTFLIQRLLRSEVRHLLTSLATPALHSRRPDESRRRWARDEVICGQTNVHALT